MKIFKLYNKLKSLPRLPIANSHIPYSKHGFTLVEMLIVAPIVILVIGIFISAIVNMTGDVLAVRGANALSYNIQDALDRIDQDTKSNDGYLATNNITLSNGQGYDNGTSAFQNATATNAMLIINSYTTTENPLSSTRNFVYETGQPNSCDSPLISQNSKVMMNIVYFVKDNTLWRRVIAPSNYLTASCSAPWQQPSCAPGYVVGFCRTQDTKLVDGIQSNGFKVDYYTNSVTPTLIPDASNSSIETSARQTAMQSAGSINVNINATKIIAGRNITQTSTVRTAKNNDTVTANRQVSVLVVGGGGGGGRYGGGGGAGGYRYISSVAVASQVYPVVVGNGGNGWVGDAQSGGNAESGYLSSFKDIVSAGGGGAGNYGNPSGSVGLNGGSGGGSGCRNVSDGGSALNSSGNTPSTSPSQGNGGGNGGGSGYGSIACGGGGGIGAVGANGSADGAGGVGVSNSISGSATWYAGGGSGSQPSTKRAGGQGGGGAGQIAGTTTADVDGTANTGGGGGGARDGLIGGVQRAGNGGSGIVIVKYPTGSLIATGGTVTTSGGNTIHTFTSSGSFIVGPSSCLAILNAGLSTTDGVHTIYTSGGAKQVYCDMQNGGWTRLNNNIATSTTPFNNSDVLITNNVGDLLGGCSNPGCAFTINSISVPHANIKVLLTRTTSIVECASLLGAGIGTSYWNGSSWVSYGMCTWNDGIYVNDSYTNMTGLKMLWKMEGSKAANGEIKFTSTCNSSSSDSGQIQVTAWVK